MNLQQLIQNDLSKIFSNHITKSITYNSIDYPAIVSDLVSLNDYNNTGIFEQSDLSLIFQTSSFTLSGITTLPKNGEYLTLDDKTLKISKVTQSSDGSKCTIEANTLKNK